MQQIIINLIHINFFHLAKNKSQQFFQSIIILYKFEIMRTFSKCENDFNNMFLFQMLQKTFEFNEQLYNPINHLTQNELMEKFNLAFYEGQNLSKADILSTFKESDEENFSEETINTNDVNEEINDDDYLIDYLLSNSPVSTPGSDVNISFDFNDFVNDFDENFKNNDKSSSIDENFDTETFTTESSVENDEKTCLISSFYKIPAILSSRTSKNCLDRIDFEEIDINEDLIDFDELPTDVQDIDSSFESSEEHDIGHSFLSPVETITRNSTEFNNFLRSTPANDITFHNQVNQFCFFVIVYLHQTMMFITITLFNIVNVFRFRVEHLSMISVT